jgi:CheY-like chemotaxis protein
MADWRPDLILLDLVMPVMDGFTFLERLRKRKEWNRIPVVTVSSKDLTAEEFARLRGHTEKALPKSVFSHEELVSTVKRLVASRHKEPAAP